jgi:hypothetical protein
MNPQKLLHAGLLLQELIVYFKELFMFSKQFGDAVGFSPSSGQPFRHLLNHFFVFVVCFFPLDQSGLVTSCRVIAYRPPEIIQKLISQQLVAGSSKDCVVLLCGLSSLRPYQRHIKGHQPAMQLVLTFFLYSQSRMGSYCYSPGSDTVHNCGYTILALLSPWTQSRRSTSGPSLRCFPKFGSVLLVQTSDTHHPQMRFSLVTAVQY